MHISTPFRRLPAPSPLAAAVALCFAVAMPDAALAQTEAAAQMLAPVVVTGARFDSDPSLRPIGATVITAEDIRNAGASDVNAAIRKIGGVYGRQSLDGSPDFSLDLRGFGSNGAQNMVVLVDGVRLSENELSNAILSTIPVDSVQRIEITRGGSSVLYGDGATGGIINIITKRATPNSSNGTVYAEGGQFHDGEVRGSFSQAWNNFAIDGGIGHKRTDNYRDNNDFKLSNASIGAQWFSSVGRVGFRYDGTRQDSRFPGGLSEAQFEANPRQTLTPKNNGSLDSDRLTGFGTLRLGDIDLAAELSHREKTSHADYFSSYGESVSKYTSKQTQFSPRLRQLQDFGAILNELVAGVDLIRWNRVTDSAYSLADATQRSKAIYVRDEIKFDSAHDGRLSAGVRRELFNKTTFDPAPGQANYGTNQGLNAWDLQGSYSVVPMLNLYAKGGQSYRVANSDENSYTPQANVPLKAQTSHDLELGASYGDAAQKVTARLFRHNLTNEIFYDPTVKTDYGFGANTNLDPTRRQGFELDGAQRISADWNVSAHYQHVKATFTDGVNNGKEMVLVPKNVLTARLTWTPANGQTADIGAQWVDGQRYGDDFNNSCGAEMPGFTTFDARYARKFGRWEFALIGLNLADKHYYSEAYSCKAEIYPSDGRQLKVSARYDF